VRAAPAVRVQKQSRKRTRAYPAQLDDTEGRIEALAGFVRLQGALIAELVQSNAELCAAQDRHDAESRIETNALIRAAIVDTLHKFDPGYRPDRFHAALIELASSFRDEAKRPKAKTGNVVLMKSSRGIIEAGRRRRDEA
jgi:hypothetical protein